MMRRLGMLLLSTLIVLGLGSVATALESRAAVAPAPGENDPEDCNLFCATEGECHYLYHNAWWVSDPDSINSSWGSGKHAQNQTPCWRGSCEFAYPAARAAECAAKQGRFWEYHDLLYARRDSLWLITFGEFARRVGVRDMMLFEASISRSDPVPVIEDGIRDARAVGGRGTPTIIVNGVYRRGIIDSADIAGFIEDSKSRR